MSSTAACDLHELSNCGLCNGADARLKSTLAEPMGQYEPGERIAPGVVASKGPGTCAGCGQGFGRGTAIRFDQRAGGWTSLGCCG